MRIVVGTWQRSPFGAFTDVMVQQPDERRTLLAPTEAIADFVATTYHFDTVEIGPVAATLGADRLTVHSAALDLQVGIGGAAPLDWLLRLVPDPLATAPRWLRLIDPVASRMVRGVHTAGTAGNGRREYYGVRRSRRVVWVTGRFRDSELGDLRPLWPPVAFGFASAPRTPQLVAVTTTIVDAG